MRRCRRSSECRRPSGDSGALVRLRARRGPRRSDEPGPVSDGNWCLDTAGADSSRYFDSKQINTTNVEKLELAWSYPSGETVFHPLVARGTVYGRGRNGAIVALDAKTGKELWIHDGMQGMTTRGMNYWESSDGKDRLIFA